MYYVIKNAPAGQWYVDLDKLGNDTVEIGMFDYQDAPVIESFTLGEEKDGRMDVSFRVKMCIRDRFLPLRMRKTISP